MTMNLLLTLIFDVGFTFRWEYEPAPDVLVRYEATVGDGRWHQTGHTRVGGRWTQTFAMNLAELAGDG